MPRRHNRRREVTLYDSAPGAPRRSLGPAFEDQSARRKTVSRSRRSLAVAMLAPALVAGLAGVLIPSGSGDPGSAWVPGSASAAELARQAAQPIGTGDLPALVPVVERNGHAELAQGAPATAQVRPGLPRHIAIPDAGVSAQVDGLDAQPTGLELPRSGRAGWWRGGPRPGEPGRAVIVGHLDSTHAADVFARVPYLKPGQPIGVLDSAGRQHLYRVVGVTRVEKANFPTEAVYGRTTRPVLVLITCGGPYDRALGHYRDNVLVYARAA
ncbi:MAG: hypothetical protein QOJ07_629 [Thermoleophilaceae bacterium]|nr:hypothetical protein [Thermoleophilaceae bacterium]